MTLSIILSLLTKCELYLSGECDFDDLMHDVESMFPHSRTVRNRYRYANDIVNISTSKYVSVYGNRYPRSPRDFKAIGKSALHGKMQAKDPLLLNKSKWKSLVSRKWEETLGLIDH